MINKEKTKIKLIIAGSRGFHDYSLLKKEVIIFTKEYNNKRRMGGDSRRQPRDTRAKKGIH